MLRIMGIEHGDILDETLNQNSVYGHFNQGMLKIQMAVYIVVGYHNWLLLFLSFNILYVPKSVINHNTMLTLPISRKNEGFFSAV